MELQPNSPRLITPVGVSFWGRVYLHFARLLYVSASAEKVSSKKHLLRGFLSEEM